MTNKTIYNNKANKYNSPPQKIRIKFITDNKKAQQHKRYYCQPSSGKNILYSFYNLKKTEDEEKNKDINQKNLNINNLIGFNLRQFLSKYKFNDYELNNLDYSEAIIIDKRSCWDYYLSLIKTKHPITFGFCPIKDYNTFPIKSCICFLSLGIYYTSNFVFFNEETIHDIYVEEGRYDIIYFIPNIGISFAVSHFFTIIIKYIFLSERIIKDFKMIRKYSVARDLYYDIPNIFVKKYVIFFIFGITLDIAFWFFLSNFGAVYQNTQKILFQNTLISVGISFIYPFFINILPCIFRICSLSDKEKKSRCKYIFSQFLQLL